MGFGGQTAIQVLMEGFVLPVRCNEVFDDLRVVGIDFEWSGFMSGKLLQGRSLIISVQFRIQYAVP